MPWCTSQLSSNRLRVRNHERQHNVAPFPMVLEVQVYQTTSATTIGCVTTSITALATPMSAEPPKEWLQHRNADVDPMLDEDLEEQNDQMARGSVVPRRLSGKQRSDPLDSRGI